MFYNNPILSLQDSIPPIMARYGQAQTNLGFVDDKALGGPIANI